MPKHYWFKFEWDKWRNDPQLRRCSKETRGFWIDCIAVMEEQDTYFVGGTVDEICREVICTREEFDRSVAELIHTNAATVQIKGKKLGAKSAHKLSKCQKGQEFVKIISRKILKDLNLTEYNRLKQRESRERRRVKTNVNAQSRLGQEPPLRLEFKSIREEKNKKEEKEKSGAQSAPPSRAIRSVRLPTRIPDPFPVTPEMWAWLSENLPGLEDPNAVHANWIEYWTNERGPKAEKVDWTLAWQKGMRLAKKWQDEDKRNGTNSKRSGPDRRTDAEILRDSAEQIASKYPN